MLQEFPIPDEAIGLSVEIVAGMLAGRDGQIDALPDDPRSPLVLIELNPHGGKVWIEVEHLRETTDEGLYAEGNDDGADDSDRA